MGWPGNRIDLSYKLAIPANVMNVRHAVARHERRKFFELWSICPQGGCTNPNYVEKYFDGAHSDIGGGYASNNDASKLALEWMWQEAVSKDVPLLPLPPEHQPRAAGVLYHDSKKGHELVSRPTCPQLSAVSSPPISRRIAS